MSKKRPKIESHIIFNPGHTFVRSERKVPMQLEVPEVDRSLIEEMLEEKPGFWDKVWFVIKNAPKLIEIIFFIFQLKDRVTGMNNDKKTSVFSYVQAGLLIILGVMWFLGIIPTDSTVMQDLMKQTDWAGLLGIVSGVLYAVVGHFTNKPDKDAE